MADHKKLPSLHIAGDKIQRNKDSEPQLHEQYF